eukprot:5806953-Alexandrium_andersonii.AAC.1
MDLALGLGPQAPRDAGRARMHPDPASPLPLRQTYGPRRMQAHGSPHTTRWWAGTTSDSNTST